MTMQDAILKEHRLRLENAVEMAAKLQRNEDTLLRGKMDAVGFSSQCRLHSFMSPSFLIHTRLASSACLLCTYHNYTIMRTEMCSTVQRRQGHVGMTHKTGAAAQGGSWRLVLATGHPCLCISPCILMLHSLPLTTHCIAVKMQHGMLS